MSKSDARKQRDKMFRETKKNPADKRGIYALANLSTKKGKKKIEKTNQVKHKGRLFDQEGYGSDNRHFLCA